MHTITNTSEGPRGFHAVEGFVQLERGASWTGEISDGELASARSTGFFEIESHLASLKGLNKAKLLAVAADEGVEVAEGATNAQIVEAIEAKRAA